MEKTQHKGVGEVTKNILGFQSAEDIHLEHSKSCMMSSTWCHVTKVSSFAQHLILAAASTSTEHNSQHTSKSGDSVLVGKPWKSIFQNGLIFSIWISRSKVMARTLHLYLNWTGTGQLPFECYFAHSNDVRIKYNLAYFKAEILKFKTMWNLKLWVHLSLSKSGHRNYLPQGWIGH